MVAWGAGRAHLYPHFARTEGSCGTAGPRGSVGAAVPAPGRAFGFQITSGRGMQRPGALPRLPPEPPPRQLPAAPAVIGLASPRTRRSAQCGWWAAQAQCDAPRGSHNGFRPTSFKPQTSMPSTTGASPQAATAPVRWSPHRSCRPASPPPRPKAPLVPYFPRLGPGSNRKVRQHAYGQPAAAGRGQSCTAAVGAGRHLPLSQPSTQQALCCPATAAAECRDPSIHTEYYRQEKQAFPHRGAGVQQLPLLSTATAMAAAAAAAAAAVAQGSAHH